MRSGVRQFLDIGSGLPTAGNVHEIAHEIDPQVRVVYVDNDPVVLLHAEALLTSSPEGACDYIEADVRDPERILEQAARTLDFSRPVGLMLMGILGLVPDHDEARSVVRLLLDALPSGSFLALNDGSTADPTYVASIEAHNARGTATPYTPRDPEEIAAFFDGLELLAPGVVSCSRWRPEDTSDRLPAEVAVHGGVGRKP